MGIRTMKLDLFTIKALQSKGYEIEQLLALSDEEVEALPISTKLIEGVKAIRVRGGQTADVIAEQIADLMMREEPTGEVADALEEYKEVPEFEAQPEEIQQSIPVSELDGVYARKITPEEAEELLKAKQEQEVETEVGTEDIIRTESKAEDIEIIKEALKGKEAKSFQPFIKHLKTAVPEAILDAVDSTVVSDLIEARIAELKAEQEKTK